MQEERSASLVVRVVGLRNVVKGAKLFVSLRLGGSSHTTAIADEDGRILEQFVLPMVRNCKLSITLMSKHWFNKRIGQAEVDVAALPSEKVVADSYGFGSPQKPVLDLLLVKTTRTDQEDQEEEQGGGVGSAISLLATAEEDDDDTGAWMVLDNTTLMKDSEDITSSKKKEQQQQQQEEKQENNNQTLSAFLQQYQIVCGVCGNGGRSDLVCLDCLHVYCHSCLEDIVKKCLSRNETPTCPQVVLEEDGENASPSSTSCGPLPDFALRAVMSDVDFSALLDRRLASVTASSGDFVHCPRCSFVFVADTTTAQQQQQQQDERRFRFRCRQCQWLWCLQCGHSPYHEGFSCESYKEYLSGRKCRFCQNPLDQSLNSNNDDDHDACSACKEKDDRCCEKILQPCGHRCYGVKHEQRCRIPCLHPDCKNDVADEFCAVCWVEPLRAGPCILLDSCGHMLHQDCITRHIGTVVGKRIGFSHLNCPLCKKRIQSTLLQPLMQPWLDLEAQVTAMASQRLQYENRQNDPPIAQRYNGDASRYAMDIYSYYSCCKCKKPYFAGLIACGDGPDDDSISMCPDCTDAASKKSGQAPTKCNKHGTDFIVWKCRYCCSPASFKCWNTHSFCDSCHTRQSNGEYLSRMPSSAFPVCKNAQECPLKIRHDHCVEWCLGCSMCKTEKNF